MTQAERRHDRLAVRLSLIISRLVAGETLSVRKLAAEFGVSVRTLQNWEQGRSQPSGAAQTLIRVAMTAPQVLRAVA